jgi:hypothetical protein
VTEDIARKELDCEKKISCVICKLQRDGDKSVARIRLVKAAATNRTIVTALGDCDGEIGRMMISRGSRSIRRKPVPVP